LAEVETGLAAGQKALEPSSIAGPLEDGQRLYCDFSKFSPNHLAAEFCNCPNCGKRIWRIKRPINLGQRQRLFFLDLRLQFLWRSTAISRLQVSAHDPAVLDRNPQRDFGTRGAPMKFLKEPRHFVIHRDDTISIRVKQGRKWRWEHNCEEISDRQFKRLLPEEQARIRRLEKRLGRQVVVPYEVGPGGVIVWETKKESGSPPKKNRS
jgi:hypothetical protein